MQVPQMVFDAGLWFAIAAVTAGAVYLLIVLVREWRRGELW